MANTSEAISWIRQLKSSIISDAGKKELIDDIKCFGLTFLLREKLDMLSRKKPVEPSFSRDDNKRYLLTDYSLSFEFRHILSNDELSDVKIRATSYAQEQLETRDLMDVMANVIIRDSESGDSLQYIAGKWASDVSDILDFCRKSQA